VIDEIEVLRSKMLLGDPLDEDDSARLASLIERAQAARKAAKNSVPKPANYVR